MQPHGRNTAATRNRNKNVVRRLIDGLNRGDTSVIDELVHPDLVDHTPAPGMPPGLEGLKQQVRLLREQFPDAHLEGDRLVATGDVVYLHWTMTGTNTGPIFGREPTGRKLTHRGHEVVRLRSGKIVERLYVSDVLAALAKLDLLDLEMLRSLGSPGNARPAAPALHA